MDPLIADNPQFTFPLSYTVNGVGSVGFFEIDVQLLGLIQFAEKPGKRMRDIAGARHCRRKMQPPLSAGTVKIFHPLYLIQNALGIAQKFLSLRSGQHAFGGAFEDDNA